MIFATRRAVLGCIGGAVTCISLPAALRADPLDSIPLDRRSKVLLTQTVTIAPSGAHASNLFVPQRGYFSVDFAVEDDKQLRGRLPQRQPGADAVHATRVLHPLLSVRRP